MTSRYDPIWNRCESYPIRLVLGPKRIVSNLDSTRTRSDSYQLRCESIWSRIWFSSSSIANDTPRKCKSIRSRSDSDWIRLKSKTTRIKFSQVRNRSKYDSIWKQSGSYPIPYTPVPRKNKNHIEFYVDLMRIMCENFFLDGCPIWNRFDSYPIRYAPRPNYVQSNIDPIKSATRFKWICEILNSQRLTLNIRF